MVLAILRFIVFLFALLSSIVWVSAFVGDAIHPDIKFDQETFTANVQPKQIRIWAALIAAVLWSILFAFL